MDFYEQIVQQKKSNKDYAVIFLTVLAGLLFVSLAFFVIPIFLPLWIFVACWFGYFVVSGRCLEFEYSISNHLLDIDRIAGKRRRRKMIVIDLKEIQGYGQVGDTGYAHGVRKGLQVLDFSSRTNGKQTCYFIVPRPKGTYIVLMDPDESMKEAIGKYVK